MTSWFISVTEEGCPWRVEPKEFVAALKRKWPEAVIVSEEPDQVWFEMEPGHGHGYVYAHLQSSGDSVVMEMVTDLRDIVTIAIWFRSMVPGDISMQLFDESYTESHPVTSLTTEGELAAAFLAERS